MSNDIASDMIVGMAIPGLNSSPAKESARQCDICDHHEFGVLGMRGDGCTIVQCADCGLATLNQKIKESCVESNDATDSSAPESPNAFTPSGSDGSQWPEALAAIIAPGMQVTHLSLPDAVPNGSLNAPVLVAAGIYEKAESFSSAVARSLELLKEDGVLLFEVPLIVPDSSNVTWLNSDFDTRYFATWQSLERLVEGRLGLHFAGGLALPRPSGSSTLIGAICKSAQIAGPVRQLFAALANGPDELDSLHKMAWLRLHILHAGHPTSRAIAQLPVLFEGLLSAEAAQRLKDVWMSTLEREDQWRRFNEEVMRRSSEREMEISRLLAELETVRHDARLNTAQAALAVVHEMERSAAALSATLRANAEIKQQYHEKERELQTLRASPLGRMIQPLSRLAAHHPRLARRTRQAAKLALWTAKGTLVKRIRETLRLRTLGQAAPGQPASSTALSGGVKLLPVAGFLPDKTEAWDYEVWPTGRPLISVVIPCFNYGHLVAEAIRSVEQQTLADIEIIVVEGGSDSVDSRRGFIQLAEQAPERVRVLLQEKPQRAGANRNFGISHARGKYICCLDADDRLAPTYLEKSLFLLEHYALDVVSPALQFFGDRHEIWAQPEERPTLGALLEGNQVLTCAVFRKSLWTEAGGFRDSDPATGHIHEDWLFWTRLAALGARFQNMREPLLLYRSHGQTLSTSSGVLDMVSQKHYITKFNQDVLRTRTTRSEMQAPVVHPLRNLARLQEQFQHSRSLLLAMPFLVLGGAERLLSSVVAHLVELGWHVTIVTTIPPDQSQGDTTSWFEQPGVSIYHFPRFLGQDRWRDFTDYLFASRQFHLLWIVGSTFFYDYLPALKDRYPDLRVADLLFNSIGHTANNRRYSRYIDINLVENQDVRGWLIAAGEHPERIETIASGVDLDTYKPGEKNPELLRQHGIHADSVIVGFSGRWSEEKNPLAVIEIASRIAADVPLVFVMTGAGPMEQALREGISNASLPAGRILVIGTVPDMAVYLRSFDVLLLPSRVDGRPNIVMEAQACGVPVVASRVGALPELVADGIQGYLCEPEAYDQFASRLTELAKSKSLLAKFKRAARTHAEQNFDVRNMQTAYAGVLDRLVNPELA